MKKLLALIIVLMLALASVTVVACDDSVPSDDPDGDNIGIPDGDENEDPDGNKNEDPDGDENEDPDGDENEDPDGNENEDPDGNENEDPDGDENEDPDGDENEDPDGNENEVTVSGIKVFGDLLTDNVVLKGAELTGLEYTVCYSDGTESNLTAVEASMIGGYDKDATGYQTVKVTYQNFEKEFEVLVADVIITQSTELEAAIKDQQDGQVWVVLAGVYDIAPEEVSETETNTGCRFAVTVNDLKIYGKNMPTIVSSVTSADGEGAFVTVSGNNVEFNGLNFVGNVGSDCVMEIVGGDNFVLSDCTINAPEEGPLFAGTVCFKEFAGKTASLKNVEMNYARIETSGCDSTSVIVMNDVTVNFAGAENKGFAQTGYSTESYYWAILNKSGANIQADGCVVTVSEGASKHKEYQSGFVAYLPENGIELTIVTEGEQENVAYVADENELEQATLVSANYSEYEIIFTEDITWTKPMNTAKVLYVDGVTISLNDKTLSANNFALVFQGNDFTIKDGKISVLNGGSYALFVGDVGYTTGSVVENVVMEGGINVYNAQVTLIDCTISATNYYAVWCDSNAQVVIESGRYDVGNGNYVLGMGETSSPDDGVISLTVNGGTYISENKLVLVDPSGKADYGSPVINAGVFNDDPSAYVNTATSEITEKDGKYYVTVK